MNKYNQSPFLFTLRVLKCPVEVLDKLLNNINLCYKEWAKAKYKNGKRKLNKDGTPRDRIINEPSKQLKILSQRINKYLAKEFPMPKYVYGGAKHKDNVLNGKYHKGNKYFFQTDLQDFFPFVTNKQVYNSLVLRGCSHDVASLITKLTTYKGHLPQGSPTSSTLANMVFCDQCGDKIQAFATENNLKFTTFVDDITLSSPTDFKSITHQVIDIILDNGFKVSYGKTTYKIFSKNLTGVKMGQNNISVTDSFYSKLKNPAGKSEETVKGEMLYNKKVETINSKKTS